MVLLVVMHANQPYLKKLREELTRALVEAREGHGTNDGDYRREGSTESFNVLVNEMTTNQQDIKTFAFRTKAMVRVHTKMYLY